jgi:hypothetical protein
VEDAVGSTAVTGIFPDELADQRVARERPVSKGVDRLVSEKNEEADSHGEGEPEEGGLRGSVLRSLVE